MIKKTIPKFRSEAEEARWWDRRRKETERWMVEAIRSGQTTTLAKVMERVRQRTGPTPTVSIRIDPGDVLRARVQAAQKGLRYQTYLKMLLHEALRREG